ncbi:MAG: hypothetical protein PHF46_03995 [Candidatus Gracilibacteria bacterium]|nr:hypothetical protein [Candidatus Gracilibacteria bacterium]MDD3120544.1 hypothetical protein [Candidatus Gracilibacteria bacterium]
MPPYCPADFFENEPYVCKCRTSEPGVFLSNGGGKVNVIKFWQCSISKNLIIIPPIEQITQKTNKKINSAVKTK